MELDIARIEINNIDQEIVKLLEERFYLVNEIGLLKREQNLPIYDNAREKEVLDSCISLLENKEYSKYIYDIYLQIMKSCKEIQKDLKEEK